MQLALDAEHQEVADLLEPYTCEVDMAALFGPSQVLWGAFVCVMRNNVCDV